jgi:hypothetical protein
MDTHSRTAAGRSCSALARATEDVDPQSRFLLRPLPGLKNINLDIAPRT